MKKLTILTALLTLSMEMWAQTQSVTYIDENGVAQMVDGDRVTVITNSTTTLNAGWYVVTGTDVETSSLTCNGEVHLILADGALLYAMGGDYQAGIQVSGEGNSLSIYGQTAQSGQLAATGGTTAAGIGGGGGSGGSGSGSGSNITINGGRVRATGGDDAAGIGGGYRGSGSNITINGGTVTATGGDDAAGIGGGESGSGSNITINGGTVTARGGDSAAGIGGGGGSGGSGSGSNITINGGSVSATGGEDGSGIGGGDGGSGSNIFMPDNYRIKAGGTFIHNDGTDLADSLAGKQNVAAYPDGLLDERDTVFAAISAAVEDISDETILAMAAAAMEAVFQAESRNDINIVLAKIDALVLIQTARQGIQNAEINSMIDDEVNAIGSATTTKLIQERTSQIKPMIGMFQTGKTEGITQGKAEAAAELLGSMGEKQNGPAVIVTDQDGKEIILYSPKKVQYVKVSDGE